MNITFEDRIVLVTGAAHGFGREIARRFSEPGFRR
jgi:NAD(P)-dependent dehydrogenase (short-subunit alcohol dehydrogenase family)